MNSHDLLTKKDLEEFKNEVFDFISNYTIYPTKFLLEKRFFPLPTRANIRSRLTIFL